MSVELAECALAVAGRAASVRVIRERSLTLRFARSRPTQSTSVDDVTVEVAALCDGHVGRASTNSTDADALGRTARAATTRAEAAARLAGAGVYPGFPAGATCAEAAARVAGAAPAPHEHPQRDPGPLDPARAGGALADAFAAAKAAGTEASGLWTAGEVTTSIASSSGRSATDRVTDAFVKVVASAPTERSGFASQTAAGADDLDAGVVAERAARRALAGGERASLEPGVYPVVMEPAAVIELLWVLSRTAFSGLPHAEGRGALAGRLGTAVASPAVSIADDAGHPSTLSRAFDAEGVPKAPLALIEDGVARAVVHDTYSAALGGAATTGHAIEPGGAAAPIPTNLVVAGGEAADEAELCAGVDRGVYVNRLWYTNVLRPKESLFTATTRDGTLLIEGGEPTRPLPDLRITDSALEILGNVQALGSRAELTSDGELYGRRFAYGAVCAPLLVSAVRFTGSADA